MNKDDVLYSIKQYDYWPEELLSEEWEWLVEDLLSPVERITLENKVEGYSNQDIARLMSTSLKNIQNVISSIKSKIKNEMLTGSKVDGWIRREEWKLKKKGSKKPKVSKVEIEEPEELEDEDSYDETIDEEEDLF